MEFRILGPLEVVVGGRALKLAGGKQRALLALLLLHANEPVSSGRLVDELWGERPTASAEKTLQVYVARLRKELQVGAGRGAVPEMLLWRAGGYLLRLEPGELDLDRFERLHEEGQRAIAAGDAALASATLRDALSLWRGPALADFRYEAFAQGAIARLEELRMRALEARAEADLALGRHGELVGELEALVAEQPLRERLRGQLMLALYRSGRQAEALHEYRQMRRALVEELGIEPGRALQQLEQKILRQDAALELVGELRAAGDGPKAERSILVVPRDERGLDALLALAEPLTRWPRRELILASVLATAENLATATAVLQERREGLLARGVAARAAAFASPRAGHDLVRLAAVQEVDLLLLEPEPALLEEGIFAGEVRVVLEEAPCDVAVFVPRASRVHEAGSGKPVLVPFGGGEHDWAALELAAWLARAEGGPLLLLGSSGRITAGRDASRLLAHASLAVQRAFGIASEPLLAGPGAEELVRATEGASLLLVGLSERWRAEGLGSVRLALARGARPPLLFVRRGVRPSGLAPRESLTRFTWSATR